MSFLFHLFLSLLTKRLVQYAFSLCPSNMGCCVGEWLRCSVHSHFEFIKSPSRLEAPPFCYLSFSLFYTFSLSFLFILSHLLTFQIADLMKMRFDEIMTWFRLHHLNDDVTPLNVDLLMEQYVAFSVFPIFFLTFFCCKLFLFASPLFCSVYFSLSFLTFLILGKAARHSSQRDRSSSQ